MRYVAKTKEGDHLIEFTQPEYDEFKRLMQAAELIDDYEQLKDGDMQEVLHALNAFSESTIVIDKIKRLVVELSELLSNPSGERPWMNTEPSHKGENT